MEPFALDQAVNIVLLLSFFVVNELLTYNLMELFFFSTDVVLLLGATFNIEKQSFHRMFTISVHSYIVVFFRFVCSGIFLVDNFIILFSIVRNLQYRERDVENIVFTLKEKLLIEFFLVLKAEA